MIRRALGGRYLLLREAGSGSMGTVYEARDKATGARVAVKVLHRHLTGERLYVDRFRAEAQVASRADSRHLAAAYAFGSDDGVYFAVFEFVRGQTLGRILAQRGALPPQEAASIALQVARALEELHGRGVLHRDVKPANVIVEPSGRAVLADFGVAMADAFATLAGPVGTPAYMAPEAAPGRFDQRSDVYSLGTLLLEMLSGARPDSWPPAATLPPQPADVPPFLWQLAARCRAPHPDDRPSTSRELRESLESWIEAQSAGLQAWALAGTAPAAGHRARSAFVGGAALIAAAAAALAVAVLDDGARRAVVAPAGIAPGSSYVEVVDRFEGSLSLLALPDEASLVDGELHVEKAPERFAAYRELVPSARDGVVEVETRVVRGGAYSNVSVACRTGGDIPPSGYALTIEPATGRYRIIKVVSGMPAPGGVAGVSTAIRRDDTNVLALRCEGQTITGSVNGIELGTLLDTRPTEGSFLLAVSAPEQGVAVEGAFDNLRVRTMLPAETTAVSIELGHRELRAVEGPSLVAYRLTMHGIDPDWLVDRLASLFTIRPSLALGPGGGAAAGMRGEHELHLLLPATAPAGTYHVLLSLPGGHAATFSLLHR